MNKLKVLEGINKWTSITQRLFLGGGLDFFILYTLNATIISVFDLVVGSPWQSALNEFPILPILLQKLHELEIFLVGPWLLVNSWS